ncbi:MAG TPA: YjjG family noncanonical pyrimidine nucleotidase [Chitinophagaceae bacterium]|nr:YjjG family noncanonical pyrimidine nucleotidase [Chitinophagaceae bacterium]
MKYRHLFFDLDHTLWDFDTNSRHTLFQLYNELELAKRGVHDFDLFHKNYLAHNGKLWERYRNGYIKVDELRVKRMWHTLLDFKIGDERLAKQMSTQFLDMLPTRTAVFPHTFEVLDYLVDKGYKLHLITNGFEHTQHSKLRHSGLDKYFVEVVTSECSNCLKPQREIFEYAMNKVSCCADECIMIGDSLEVDIQGAMNAGIDQVFVDHLCIGCAIQPTYVVKSLDELKAIF